MTSLYILTRENLVLADRCGAGELDDADLDAIEANEAALKDKAAGYVAVYRTLDAEAESFEAEARRFTEMARHRRNASKRLRERLVYCLDTCGIERLPTTLGTLRTQANRPAFTVPDPTVLPSEFLEVETIYKPIDKLLLAAHKAGNLPDGVTATVGRHLRLD